MVGLYIHTNGNSYSQNNGQVSSILKSTVCTAIRHSFPGIGVNVAPVTLKAVLLVMSHRYIS